MSLETFKSGPIYKVTQLIGEKTIKAIHVFYGNNMDIEKEKEDPNELFKRDPQNNAFIDPSTNLPIFNEEELKTINEQQIPVIFST